MKTWSLITIVSKSTQVLPRLYTRHHALIPKVRVQKSYSPYTISYGPCLSCSTNLFHIHRHLSSHNLNCIPTFSLIRFSSDGNRLNNTTLDTTHSSGHAFHTYASETILGSHSQIICIVREHKHCPRTQFLTNKRV